MLEKHRLSRFLFSFFFIHINKYLPSHICTEFVPLSPVTYICQEI